MDIFERPAITTATNGDFSLQLIVESLSTEAEHQVTKLYRAIQVKSRRTIHQGIQAKLRQTIQVKFRRVIQAKLCRVIQAKLHSRIHLASQAQLHQVTPITPATIRDDSFKLIDALASEGAIFAPYIFEDSFTPTHESNHEREWAQATSRQTSKLLRVVKYLASVWRLNTNSPVSSS